MTLEQAERIRQLLDARKELICRKEELENCTVVSGTISDGYNGRPFRWNREDREVKHLIHGLTKDIASLTEAITSLQIEGEGF